MTTPATPTMTDRPRQATHNSGHTGPYDTLYQRAPRSVLWTTGESRLARAIAQARTLPNRRVLDLGCGDGANAIYLEERGFKVWGLDVSLLALGGLRNRFEDAGAVPRGDYEVGDARTHGLPKDAGAVLMAGLLHCMRFVDQQLMIRRALHSAAPGGLVAIATLTADIPLPTDHGTPDLDLPEASQVVNLIAGLKVLELEQEVIDDEHPGVRPHQHSVLWAIIQR